MKNIYIGDTGKGFPLVLVHGFLGSSIIWEPQIKFFRKFYRVITPDLPGFGKSNKVKSLNSIKLISNLLLESLKKKDINKFHLLGHSMGGMIVQQMVKTDSKKISKLICYSTGPRGKMPGRFETVEQSKKNIKLVGLKTSTRNIAKTWFVKKSKAKYFDICIKSANQASEQAVNNALTAFKKWNGVKALKNIKNDTLIVWGDKDKSYNISQIKILNKNILNSSLIVFKGCAHNIHLEKVNKFNEKIKNFLDK